MIFRVCVRLLVLCLICFAAPARGEDKFSTVERADFTIDLPHYFMIESTPGEAVALEVWAPPATDQRGLSWSMSVRVEVGKGVNLRRVPVEHAVQQLVENIRKGYGKDLLGGPAVVAVPIPGADGAMMIIYRTRERGLLWWRFDVHVHAGTDVHIISAFLNARAGSEVLDKDHASLALLRKAVLSYKVVPPPATQATTQPATAPAAPTAPATPSP